MKSGWILSSPCCWGDRCLLFCVSYVHRSWANLCGSQWRTFLYLQSSMNQAWRDTAADVTLQHLTFWNTWQVVIASCWNSDGWKHASVLIHYIIYSLARWAKVNTQQLRHLGLNFCLLPWNFIFCSHSIYHHCSVYLVCCVPRINLQFCFFTVKTVSLTNVSFHTQHYSFSEEWLEESSEAKRSKARPIFWFAFIQRIDSFPLEKLLSENFAWTKNKSSRTTPSF